MTDFTKYEEYYKKTLYTLMNTPSPSGYYHEVMPVVKALCEAEGCEFEMTRKGCGIITVKGEDDTVIGCAAHCDTLGAMVRHIDDNGDITFTRVGGPMLNTLDGEYCTVLTRDGRKYTGTFLSRSPAAHVYDDAESSSSSDEGGESQIVVGLTNCYYQVGGRTYHIADYTLPSGSSGFIALRVPANTATPNASVQVYANLSALQAAQANLAYCITPLYIVADSVITLDMRRTPFIQLAEVF